MCSKVASKDLFLIAYCPDKYKTQRMCDKPVDDCLAALKFIPDWFATSKTIIQVKLFYCLLRRR